MSRVDQGVSSAIEHWAETQKGKAGGLLLKAVQDHLYHLKSEATQAGFESFGRGGPWGRSAYHLPTARTTGVMDRSIKHSIRRIGNNRLHAHAGDTIELFAGPRTAPLVHLGSATCLYSAPVALLMSPEAGAVMSFKGPHSYSGRGPVPGYAKPIREVVDDAWMQKILTLPGQLDLFAQWDGHKDWAAMRAYWAEWSEPSDVGIWWCGWQIMWGDTFCPVVTTD